MTRDCKAPSEKKKLKNDAATEDPEEKAKAEETTDVPVKMGIGLQADSGTTATTDAGAETTSLNFPRQ